MTYTCIETLSGHDNVRYLVKINDETLSAGSYDWMIKIWNLKRYDCIGTLIVHHNAIINSLILNDGRLATGSNNMIKIWNPNSFECYVDIPKGNLIFDHFCNWEMGKLSAGCIMEK